MSITGLDVSRGLVTTGGSINGQTEIKRLIKIEKLPEVKEKQVSIAEQQLLQAIEKANKVLVGPEVMLKFSIHKVTKQIMVKMLNEETGELIREIPPEKILDMVAKIWELAGIIVDKRV
ncbi:MAG: flagellar protein FlaG [Bacillota bacterium]